MGCVKTGMVSGVSERRWRRARESESGVRKVVLVVVVMVMVVVVVVVVVVTGS